MFDAMTVVIIVLCLNLLPPPLPFSGFDRRDLCRSVFCLQCVPPIFRHNWSPNDTAITYECESKVFPSLDSFSFVALFIFVCVPNSIWCRSPSNSMDSNDMMHQHHNLWCNAKKITFFVFIIYGTVNTLSLIAKELKKFSVKKFNSNMKAKLKFNKSKSNIWCCARNDQRDRVSRAHHMWHGGMEWHFNVC